jgi:IclR family acetate operon transcriptional repressor
VAQVKKGIRIERGSSSAEIPALARGMRVLELLADHPEGLNLVEIAAALDLPVNSTQRIALAFCELGYAQRDMGSKRFFLTSKLLSVGSRGLGESSLVERSLDVMRELRDTVRETVLLFLLSGDEVVLLEQVLSLHSFKFMVDPGTRWPLHTNAPGKALWAFMPESQRDGLLARSPFSPRTSRTITTSEAMRGELERVCELGYAVDIGEDAEGCNCAAAPVLDRHGYPLAAICVSGPANRLTEAALPQVGLLVKDHTARISQRFGHTPPAGT